MAKQGNIPKHIAIIMDGNGRWAKKRGLSRLEGHAQGVESVRSAIETSAECGVEYLTLYTFSTENWGRAKEEVEGLMKLLCESVVNELEMLKENGAKVLIIGNREGVSQEVKEHIEKIETQTKGGDKITVVLAINYGAREEIVGAVRSIAEMVRGGEMEIGEITEEVVESQLATVGVPDPDLLIRPGGEFRLSNFLLWQLKYTELYFTETLWPDFGAEELKKAIDIYANRERRFGLVK